MIVSHIVVENDSWKVWLVTVGEGIKTGEIDLLWLGGMYSEM